MINNWSIEKHFENTFKNKKWEIIHNQYEHFAFKKLIGIFFRIVLDLQKNLAVIVLSSH